MDAKPQRLVRSRTLRDENQVPTLFAGKTIHQRNKSSPALSSQAQSSVTQKAAPKRTVFADLSNNARGINVVKDDSIIGQKAAVEVLKETVSQDGASNPPLQRPAQRPLSVSGIKGFFNFTTGQQSQAAKKTQPDVVNSLNPQPQLRRAITKKATTVFRESEPDSQTSSFEGKPAFPNSSGDEVKLQKENTSENIRKPEAVVKSEAGTLVTQPTSKGGALTTAASDDIRANGTTLHELSYAELVYSAENVFPGIPPLGPAMPTLIQPHPIRPIDKPSGQPKVERRSGSSVVAVYPTVAEQWEDDHYVENDADYTTARSLKSRGECTTNPTTIVLAPKMTATAEKELEEATRFVQQSQEATELEEDEAWDTSMVAEYSEEIFSYMRNLEEQMRPNPHYMDNQSEVQWSMRSVLMDWLVQVHHRFSLLPETLFLCVNYIDRFLSCKVVSLGKLQLVGATAIFVAAKYEEINCPSVQEIVYMVDGGYTVDEILKAERFMLSMLQFELGWPGPMSFLRRISKADDYDLESRTLAKYFMEITIMDERFVGCIPSYTAAGAHCLARLMLDKGTWSQKHVHYSGYTYSQLRPLLLTTLSCCDDPQRHHAAIFDKYADKRFKRASSFVQSELNRGFVLPSMPTRNSIGYENVSGSFVYQ